MRTEYFNNKIIRCGIIRTSHLSSRAPGGGEGFSARCGGRRGSRRRESPGELEYLIFSKLKIIKLRMEADIWHMINELYF